MQHPLKMSPGHPYETNILPGNSYILVHMKSIQNGNISSYTLTKCRTMIEQTLGKGQSDVGPSAGWTNRH